MSVSMTTRMNRPREPIQLSDTKSIRPGPRPVRGPAIFKTSDGNAFRQPRTNTILSSSSASAPTSNPSTIAAVLPVAQPEGDETVLLKRLLGLNKASSNNKAKLDEFATQSGLSVVATSSTRSPLSSVNILDTFEDYEDMQGVPINDMQQGTDEQVPSFLNVPGLADLEAAARGAQPERPMENTGSVDWDSRVSLDASMDAHTAVIDMYGDGSAVSSPVCSVPEHPSAALRQAATANVPQPGSPIPGMAGGMKGQFSNIQKMAQSAMAALSGIPTHSQWVVLDDATAGMRIVVLNAGSEARTALQSSQAPMVPFECSRYAKISPALQLEARHMFMELMPVILEATEKNMEICLTGLGAGGSLASVVALMCAHQGLGDSKLNAVVFDAQPCIGEVPKIQAEGEQAEQAMIESVMADGLLSDMGLASSTIRSVLVESTAANVMVQRSTGAQSVTLFKPLGTVLKLSA